MSEQLDLLAWQPPAPPPPPPPPPPPTPASAAEEEAFLAFDRANPAIWRLFVRFAFEKIRQGFTHYGARDILHRIRWETEIAEADGTTSGFKINNIWSPWYARKFHRMFPEHDGFFRLRAAKADGRDDA